MSTERFEVAYSHRATTGRIEVLYPTCMGYFRNSASMLCNGIRAALEGAGWMPVGDLHARFSFWFPLGCPLATPPEQPVKPVRNCVEGILSIAGAPFCLYDPYRETPGNCLGGVWVPMGTTHLGTMENLANAITAASPFVASPRLIGPHPFNWAIDCVAKQGGTEWNNTPLKINGGWIAGLPTPVGGGWMLASGLANGDTGYYVEVAEYTADWWSSALYWLDPAVWLDVPAPFGVVAKYDDQHITRLRFSLAADDLGHPEQNRFDVFLRTCLIYNYRYFANPYMFMIYHPEHVGLGSASWWHTAVFACAPQVPWRLRNPAPVLEKTPLKRALFVVSDRSLSRWLYWKSAGVAVGLTRPGVEPKYTYLRQFPMYHPTSKEAPGVVMSRFDPGSTPLLTEELKQRALIQNAWISLAPVGEDGEGEVVGKIWDAVALSDHRVGTPPGGWPTIPRMSYAGKSWRCVCSQPGIEQSTRGSLWVLEGET